MLFYPKRIQLKNRLKYRGKSAYAKAVFMGLFGILFWAAIFIVFCRVLYYFRGIDVFGDFLASKLLSMVFLTFFTILIFSNIITALSSFYMSDELHLVIAGPYDSTELYSTKLIETMCNSSWMVLLFSLPVFLSYGVIFRQDVTYYCAIAGTLLPFLVISAALGTGISMMLVKVFPARRLKDVLMLLSLVLVVGLYFFFRLLRPERLVDPDAFFTVVDYLTSLRTPSSPFLPSQWATDVLSGLLFQNSDPPVLFNLGMLWSTAAAFVVILCWCFKMFYFDSWSKAQESRTMRVTRHRIFNRLFAALIKPFPVHVKALIEKDMKTFFRDTAQWSQLLILFAIIVIYLYNFSVLPIDKSPIPTAQLQSLIAFLNLGLAGFVITAVAVRFAFPAVSIEGESFWIIKSSPMGLKVFLWCKFWINFLFLVLLSEMLIVFSNYLLRVDAFMMAVSTVTVFLMTFGLTSLSIGCGAAYPRFKYENIAQIPTGFGGLLYMLLSVLFVGLIVVCEAWPVHVYIMATLTGTVIRPVQWLKMGGAFFSVLSVSCAMFVVPMRMGLSRLSSREDFP